MKNSFVVDTWLRQLTRLWTCVHTIEHLICAKIFGPWRNWGPAAIIARALSFTFTFSNIVRCALHTWSRCFCKLYIPEQRQHYYIIHHSEIQCSHIVSRTTEVPDNHQRHHYTSQQIKRLFQFVEDPLFKLSECSDAPQRPSA